MRFELNTRGPKEDILKAVEDDKNVPATIGDLIAKQLDTYTDPKAMFAVRVNGNLNEPGYNGNSNLSFEVIKTNELHPSFHNQDAPVKIVKPDLTPATPQK